MSNGQKFFKYALIAICLISIFLVTNRSLQEREAEVIFCNVGQGDAALIKTKEVNVVIDGGPDKKILECLGKHLPFYRQEIDLLILTHPHADHVTGFNDVLEKYPVKRIWLTGVIHTSSVYLNFLKLIKDKNILSQVVSTDTFFEVSPGIDLQVLHPDVSLEQKSVADLNNSSVVIRLNVDDISFLFSGDIGIGIEERLIKNQKGNLKSSVLKVAHQGSDTSSSEEFLETVAPQYAVISVGDNSYGHPTLRVLKRLERLGVKLLRTDKHGDVVFNVKKGELLLINKLKD